jgi:LPS sulfotransferase NodH
MTQAPPAAPASFVIVTLPRSGSYNLVSLLNSAPDIVCHGEVFKRDVVELPPGPLGKLGMKTTDIEERDARPVAFLNRLRAINARKIVGFKMFPEHASRLRPLREQVLRSPKWRKIFLHRDAIESYASLLRAKQTGIWAVRSTAPAPPPRERLDARVLFSPETFDEHMQLTGWFDKLAHDISAIPGNPCLRVDYEALADRSALPGVLGFLGSGAVADALTSEFEKQFSGPLSEAFSNWPELVAHVKVGA